MKATVNLIWNALLTAVVVTLLAGLFVAAMPPVYLATATVKGDADGILIIRSGDLIAEVTRVVKPQPDDLRSWLQELTSESTDVPTMLKQNLTVEARPGEGWLDITVQARVSVTAARLANEIASAYLSRVDQNNLTPEAMAMLFQPVEDAEAFQQQIAAIASEFGVLRAKGRVDVTGKALPFVVQAVGRRVDGYFARDRDSVSGRLVVIGMNGLDVAAIATRLGGELIDGHASS